MLQPSTDVVQLIYCNLYHVDRTGTIALERKGDLTTFYDPIHHLDFRWARLPNRIIRSSWEHELLESAIHSRPDRLGVQSGDLPFDNLDELLNSCVWRCAIRLVIRSPWNLWHVRLGGSVSHRLSAFSRSNQIWLDSRQSQTAPRTSSVLKIEAMS